MACVFALGLTAALAGTSAGADPLKNLPLSNSLASRCPSVARENISLPATRAALREGKPVTILAFGSSSTEGSGASAPQFRYPNQLQARLRAAMPGAQITVVNRGKGGEDVDEMLPRLGGTLAETKPTLVIWQAGSNAAMRRIDPAHFEAMMRQGIEMIRASGADLVLMDNQRSPRILSIANHATFDDIMARLATENGISVFSRFRLMTHWEEKGLLAAQTVGGDGVHHTDLGYTCLSAALTDSVLAATTSQPIMAGR
ncbi:SGNH/GDSL hydrolase family protein [Acetobacteraceae bacterium H6797]|nr:SGNH/GDSL hydrolase family protein [Acetobacteraceae bacterium H6797]